MLTTDALKKIFGEVVDRTFAANHRTGWFDARKVEIDGTPGGCFVFYSVNKNTAEKARKVLADAGCLCDLVLGRVDVE